MNKKRFVIVEVSWLITDAQKEKVQEDKLVLRESLMILINFHLLVAKVVQCD